MQGNCQSLNRIFIGLDGQILQNIVHSFETNDFYYHVFIFINKELTASLSIIFKFA